MHRPEQPRWERRRSPARPASQQTPGRARPLPCAVAAAAAAAGAAGRAPLARPAAGAAAPELPVRAYGWMLRGGMKALLKCARGSRPASLTLRQQGRPRIRSGGALRPSGGQIVQICRYERDVRLSAASCGINHGVPSRHRKATAAAASTGHVMFRLKEVGDIHRAKDTAKRVAKQGCRAAQGEGPQRICAVGVTGNWSVRVGQGSSRLRGVQTCRMAVPRQQPTVSR